MMNRILIAVGVLGLVAGGVAYATSHTMTFPTSGDHVWPIKRVSDPDAGRTGDLAAAFVLGSCTGSSCPHYGESGLIVAATARDAGGAVLSPAWTFAKCMAYYDGATDTAFYQMEFWAAAGSWPSVWPATLRCSGTCVASAEECGTQGDTLDVTVTLGNAVDSNWAGDAMATITLAGGKTVTFEKNAAGAKVQSGSVLQRLPAGSYTDQTIQAKKSNGTTWTGVTCTIDEVGAGTVDTIAYKFTDTAVAHTGGYCTVNGVNSPLSLVRQ